MNKKFAMFQWKLFTFTTWQNQVYSYRNQDKKLTTMKLPYNAINGRNVRFKLILLE